jgi:BlaI family transcriptional regulator, penicillinase repressor
MADQTPLPTNAELEILRILWREGPQTVRQVHDTVRADRDVQYTTVLKTLQVMSEKGLVVRDESTRSHVYDAAVAESAVKHDLVSDILDRVFDGSAANLVMQALASTRATPEELRQIRRMLGQLNRGESQ